MTPIFNSQPATSQISSLKMVTSQISGIEKYEADMITEQNGTSGKVLAPTILPPKPASTEKTAGEHIGDLKYAVGTPQRPWQLYRRYSKAARGLPDS